jgi:hypothetical protein
MMKTKKIQYSIQNPCDKNWNDMRPETNGRFCGSCEKSVVDFTSMSDFSIVNYLENHKNEKVCGRFTKPQLDRVYQLNQPVFAPSFDLRAVVLGLALTTFSAIHSFSQTESLDPAKIDTLITVSPTVVGKVAPSYNHVGENKASGVLITGDKKFKGITVQLRDVKGQVLKTLKPDSKGRFAFDLDWRLKPAFIEVFGENYETTTVSLKYVHSLTGMKIELMERTEMIRGEIEVIQGDVKETEDQILQKVEIGNVNIKKTEK